MEILNYKANVFDFRPHIPLYADKLILSAQDTERRCSNTTHLVTLSGIQSATESTCGTVSLETIHILHQNIKFIIIEVVYVCMKAHGL